MSSTKILLLQVKLIIIDSITAVLRPEFDKSENIERVNLCARLVTLLKQIAVKYELCVLIVNQVSDNFDQTESTVENRPRKSKPALGLFWRNLIDEAFFIEKIDQTKRTIEVTKSFRLTDDKLTFEITNNGLEKF